MNILHFLSDIVVLDLHTNLSYQIPPSSLKDLNKIMHSQLKSIELIFVHKMLNITLTILLLIKVAQQHKNTEVTIKLKTQNRFNLTYTN